MKCKQFKNKIEKFIANDMDIDELNSFLNHIDECKECAEELDIMFLVNKALDDNNDKFDFKGLLRKQIEDNRYIVDKELKLRFIVKCSCLTSTIISFLAFVHFIMIYI